MSNAAEIREKTDIGYVGYFTDENGHARMTGKYVQSRGGIDLLRETFGHYSDLRIEKITIQYRYEFVQ